MYHPVGRCNRCGERLYAHVDGGTACHNCGARYETGAEDGDTDENDESEDEGGASCSRPLPRS